MNKLKPCPFCGGEASVHIANYAHKNTVAVISNTFVVTCDDCEISTKSYESQIWQDDEGNVRIDKNGAEEAIEAWNRRVE